MNQATALAHPNIALVKYWGKRASKTNIPATPSLSITLDTLVTQTSVRESEQDQIEINGTVVSDKKIEEFLIQLRAAYSLPPLSIESFSNFPSSAGLASSASGFAALLTAIDAAFRLEMSTSERSIWARRGSGSAARSIFGGFASREEENGDWCARNVLPMEAWPLKVVIAITSETAKNVGSTEGMERSEQTSPYYGAWTESTRSDHAAALLAVSQRDFSRLASIAESSCLKMHALMLSSQPPLSYWNGATVETIAAVRELQGAGVRVFFTIDAGPQVKALCQEDATDVVAERLASVPGVLRTLVCGLGPGAYVDQPR
ncbi:MAG: diphosphomevalonate decarboxylase [Pseudomonadota bacterium]|nr:diphosphomevalonate decarboxylase [Pseudomonadota bacterium]